MNKDSATAPAITGLAIGIALIVLFFLLFGPTTSFPPQSVENVVITLERTACFGSCPDYSLTVYGNGTVIYDGRNFVAVTGRQISSISQDNLHELVRTFYAIGYFSMQDEYSTPVTDLPTTTTSIAIDGRYKHIVNYYGAPETLTDLENKIDDITGTEMWIGR